MPGVQTKTDCVDRLETLCKLNTQREWTNNDLYRLMFKEDMYVLAYERIKSKCAQIFPGEDTGNQEKGGHLTSLQRTGY